MSRIVDDSVFKDTRDSLFKEKYPYDEWLDEKPRILTRGEDFDQDATVMGIANSIRHGIKKRGYRARIRVINNDEIAVQALWR